MRKTSSSVLSHLRRHTKTTFFRISKNLIAHLSSQSTITTPANDHYHNHPSSTPLKACNKSDALVLSKIKTKQFMACPSKKFNTLVEQQPSQMSSGQTKIKERSELEEAFESAKTSEDMLNALKDTEASFDERELGLVCLKLGLKFEQEGEDPEKTLSFANRALIVLNEENEVSLPLAMTLQLLGSACHSLNKFNDSLGYLNRANRVLGRLEEQGSCSLDDIRPVLHAVQFELANTKMAMGRREEALGNLRRCLEIKEMTLEKDSRELGNAYRDLAEAYVAGLNFRKAEPFCLKALEIHKAQLGHNSVEVAHDRRILGHIYTGLEQQEKALEQNNLSRRILKNWGLSSDLLHAQIDAANM